MSAILALKACFDEFRVAYVAREANRCTHQVAAAAGKGIYPADWVASTPPTYSCYLIAS